MRLMATAFFVASTLNLLWLWDAPLADTTEARHAEVGREFAEGGHWLIPTLNYQPHLTKPPLTDWLVALGIKLFGANEFGARFFGAMIAALGLALVAGFAFRVAGKRAAISAAAFYLTTPVYLVLSRTISIDILLATFTVGGYWAIWEASREGCSRPRAMALAYWGLLGLGAITKGHIILLVALLPVIAWMIWGRRWQLAKRMFWPPAILAFLLIALPWYIYIASVFPDWLGKMATNELSQRAMGAEFGDANFGLSILYFMGGALFCIPPAVVALLGKERGKSIDADARKRGTTRLLALWALLPLAVFSAASAQRTNYITPLIPAAAILAGIGWAQLMGNWRKASRAPRAAVYLVLTALLLAAPACIWAATLAPEMQLQDFLPLAVPAVLLGAASAHSLLSVRRGRLPEAIVGLAAAVASMWLFSVAITTQVKHERSTREACRKILSDRSSTSKLPIAYKTESASARFYLRNGLRQRGADPIDFEWPKDMRSSRPLPPEVDAQEISNAARRKAGVWVFLDIQQDLEMGKYLLKTGAHVRSRQAFDKTIVLHIVKRPLMIAPAETDAPHKSSLLTIPTEPASVLARGLKNPRPKARTRAAKRLALLGPKALEVLPAIVAALEDADPRVRKYAAQALGNIGEPATSAVPKLLKLLEDPKAAVRAQAIHALVLLRAEPEEFGGGLLTALADKAESVRREAAWALGELKRPPPGAVTALTDATQDGSVEVRLRSVRSLGAVKASSGRAAAALVICLKSENWRVRRYAASALGNIEAPGQKAILELTEALRDDDWEVRRVAAWALGRSGVFSRQAMQYLEANLTDEYWRARSSAAKTLGIMGPAARSTAPSLRRALRDPEPQVRASAARALLSINPGTSRHRTSHERGGKAPIVSAAGRH